MCYCPIQRLLLYISHSLSLALTNKLLLLLLVLLPPNPAAGAGTGAVAGAGAIAGGPLLSCHPPAAPHATVRVRRNTAPRRADLQQVVGLR